MYLFLQGAVNGTGVGSGALHSSGSSGAGHGGRGGRGNQQPTTGAFYGDVIMPQTFGSTGGGGQTPGGGVFYLTAKSLTVDGSIEVNGQSATSSSSLGGGSGGSILIDVNDVEGSGFILANGGSGGRAGGGGGSGGRISVHSSVYSFSGVCSAFGGDSPIEVGAAGTIVRLNKGNNYRILEVNNQGRSPSVQEISDFTRLSTDSARTWLPLISFNSTQVKILNIDLPLPLYPGYRFDELKLGGSAHLALEPHPHRHQFHEFTKYVGDFAGNSYGYLHTGPREFVSISQADYYIPANFLVYPSGYLKLPSRVMLHRNSLSLKGYLAGISDLTISLCTLNFGSSSAALTRGRFHTRHFKFDSLSVMYAGLLRMNDTKEQYTLESKNVRVLTGGHILASNLALVASTVSVDESGVISLDGQGTPCRSLSSVYSGAGGSHAGFGGFGTGGRAQKPFGLVFSPSEFGGAGVARSGYACTTGGGGGKINMTIATKLVIQGTISARYEFSLLILSCLTLGHQFKCYQKLSENEKGTKFKVEQSTHKYIRKYSSKR